MTLLLLECMQMPNTTQPAHVAFGVQKVGSHHWSFFVGDYLHGRIYCTRREAFLALETHIEDMRESSSPTAMVVDINRWLETR
jgi:hypothetical protein